MRLASAAQSLRVLPRPDLLRPAVEEVAKVLADERKALPDDSTCVCAHGRAGRG